MSTAVEQRIVEMKFDRKGFSEGVKDTLKDLDTLEKGLEFRKGLDGLKGLQKSVDAFKFDTLVSGIQGINDKLQNMQSVGYMVFENLTNKAINWATTMTKSLSVDRIRDGFSEYELKMDSVRTIMSSTGKDIDTVNKYLEELNEYSDKTIYSFSDMTSSIGKFTNAGVDLDKAVMAIKGISSEAALSGANAQQASHAMYNFAQALSSGAVKLIDWKSIENANMATKEFKEELLKTAESLGTVVKTENGYLTKTAQAAGKTDDMFDAVSHFNDSLKDEWMTSEVLVETLSRYADETSDIGSRAMAAAQEVTTYSKMMDALREQVGSGWSQTFEILFGNLEEAKVLWTNVNNVIGGFISRVSDTRNGILQMWKAAGANKDILAGLTNIYNVFKNIGHYVGLALETLFGHRTLQNFDRVKSFFADKESFTGNLVVIQRMSDALISFSKSFRQVTDDIFKLFDTENLTSRAFLENIYQSVQAILIPLRAIGKIAIGITKTVIPKAARVLYGFALSVSQLIGSIGYIFTGGIQKNLYDFADSVVGVFSNFMRIFDMFERRVIEPLRSTFFVMFTKFIYTVPALLNPALSFIGRVIQEISKASSAFLEGVIASFERFLYAITVSKDTLLRLSVNAGRAFSSLKVYATSVYEALDPVIKAISEMGERFNLFKTLKLEFNIPGSITAICFSINRALILITDSLGTIIHYANTGAIQALSFAFRVLNMVVTNVGIGLLQTISYAKRLYNEGSSYISRLIVGFDHFGAGVNLIFTVITDTISSLMEKFGLVTKELSFVSVMRDLGNSIYSVIYRILSVIGNVISALRNSVFEATLEIVKRLDNKLPKINAFLINTAFAMQKSASAFLGLVDKVGGRFKNLGIALRMLFNLIRDNLKTAVDQISGISKNLTVVNAIKSALVGVFEILSKVVVVVGKIFGFLGSTIFGTIMFVLETLSKKLPSVTLSVFNAVYGLQKAFASIGEIVETISRRFGFLRTAFSELFATVSDKMAEILNSVNVLELKLNFVDTIKTALSIAFGLIGKIVSVVGRLIGFLGSVVFESTISALRFIADIMPKVTLQVLNAARGLKQFFATVKDSQGLRYLQFAFEKVQTSFGLLVSTIKDELIPGIKSIFDFSDDVNLNNLFGDFSALNIVKSMLSGLTGALKSVYSMAVNVVSTIMNIFSELGKLSIDYITDGLYWVAQRMYDIIGSIKSLLDYFKYSEFFNKTLGYIHSGLKLVTNNFRLLVSTLKSNLLPAIKDIFGFVNDANLPKLGGIVDVITSSFKGLMNVIKMAGGFISGVISSFGELLKVLTTMAAKTIADGLYSAATKLMDIISAVGRLVNYLKYSPAFKALIESVGNFTRALGRLGVVIKANVLRAYEQLVSVMSSGDALTSGGGNMFVKVLTLAFKGLGKAINLVFKAIGIILKPIKYLFDLLSPIVVSTLTMAFNGLAWICNKLQLYIYYLRQDLGKIIDSFKITSKDTERVTNSISRLKNQFSRTLTTVTKFVKAGLKPLLDVLGDFKTNGFKGVTDWLNRLATKAKDNGKAGVGAFFERIASALKSITSHGVKVRDVFRSIFTNIKPGVITVIEKGLDLITSGLKNLNDMIWNLWTGVSPILDKIKQTIGPIFNGVGEFFKSFVSNINLGDKLKAFIDTNSILSDNPLEWLLAGMKQSFDKVVNWLKETEIGKIITNLIYPKDENGDQKQITSFKDLLEALKAFPKNAAKNIADFFQQMWNSISQFATDKIDKLSSSLSELREAIFGKKDEIDETVMKDPERHPFIVLLSKIGEFLGKLVDTVATIGLSGLDTITALFKRIALLATIFYAVSIVRNSSRAVSGISNFFVNIGKTAKQIKNVMKATKWTMISDFILDFAKSIAMVAGAIYVISTIPQDALIRGLGTIVLVGALLVGLYALRKYIDGKYSSSGKWAQVLENLGGDTQKMGSLISIIVDGITGLGEKLVKGVTKFLGKLGTVALIIGGVIALFGMVALLKGLTNISLPSIIASIIKLGIIAAALFAFYKILDKNKVKKKNAMLRVGATLLLLNGIISIGKRFVNLHKVLNPIHFLDLGASLLKMTAIVGATIGLAVILEKLTKKAKNLKATVSILLKLSVALGVLGIVMRIVGSMDIGTMAKALVSLGVVVGLMWVLSKIAAGFKSASKDGLLYLCGALIACAGAIWIFSNAVATIADAANLIADNWLIIAGVLAGFAVFSVILIGAAIAISNAFPIAGPIVLMLAGAVTLLGLAFYFVGAGIKAAVEGIVLFVDHLDQILNSISGKEAEITEAITVIITAIVTAIGKGLTYINSLTVDWMVSLLTELDAHAYEMGKLSAGAMGKFIRGFVDGMFENTDPILKPVIDKINNWFSEIDLGEEHSYDKLAKDAAARGEYELARYFEAEAANIEENGKKPVEAAGRVGSGVIEAYSNELKKGGIGPLAEATGHAMDEVNTTIDTKTPEVEEKASTSTTQILDLVSGLLKENGTTQFNQAASDIGGNITWDDIYSNLLGSTEGAAGENATAFAELYKELMGSAGIDGVGETVNTDFATGLGSNADEPIGEVQDTSDELIEILNTMGFEGLSADQMADWATGVSNNAYRPIGETGKVADGAVDVIESKSVDYNGAVGYLLSGMVNVIRDQGYCQGGFVDQMGALADAGCSEIERRGRISSPSKRTYKIGGFFVDGLVNAIKDGNSDASSVGGGIAESLIQSIKSALSFSGGLSGLADSSLLRITPVLDSTSTIASMSSLRSRLNTTSPLKMGADLALGKVDISSAVGDLSAITTQGNSDLLSAIQRQNDELARLNYNLENQKIYLDGNTLVGKTVARMDQALGRRAVMAGGRR